MYRRVEWDLREPESGLSSLSVALREEGDDGAALATLAGTPGEGEGSLCFDVSLSASLVDGTAYLFALSATNGAGLSASLATDAFVVDTSGPTVGSVEIELVYPSGFNDQVCTIGSKTPHSLVLLLLLQLLPLSSL